VPAFLPSFHEWRKPALPFSWRAVLAREYSTVFSVVVTFFLLELAGGFFRGNTPVLDPGWMLFVSAGLAFYATSRWMAKQKMISVRRS
jgi:hypothetical protein